MTRIVTYARRPKRAPRKKAQAAAITGPAIVTAASRQVAVGWASDEPTTIITAKNPHRRGRLGDVPDLTEEEYQRRCDAAGALFRELVRQATGKR